MKKYYLLLVLVSFSLIADAQVHHLYEHTYPVVVEEHPLIRELMDQVSEDSLYATIDHMQSYHTRRWDSRMVYEVQDWLYHKYNQLGFDSVYLHDFTFLFHDTLRETSDNVIAVQRGTRYPDEYVVCGAHYDSYNNTPGNPDSLRAPGADDNASGVAGVMEMARLLKHCKFERSIIYCHFAAEEAGLIGSAAYAKDCAEQLMDIVGYFNLDMIGYLKESSEMHVRLLYTTRDSIIANYVYNFSEVYFPEMRIWQGWLSWGDSDYSSFNRNGYPAVHTFEDTHHSSPFIHTPDDVLGVSVNNMSQAKRFTELNLGLVATLAGLDTHGVDDVTDGCLSVYPNPAKELLTVKGMAMRHISINNMMGQQVISRVLKGDEECAIPLGALAPGIYFVKATSSEGSVVARKVVVY